MPTTPGILFVSTILLAICGRDGPSKINPIDDHSDSRTFNNRLIVQRNVVIHFSSVAQLEANAAIWAGKCYCGSCVCETCIRASDNDRSCRRGGKKFSAGKSRGPFH